MLGTIVNSLTIIIGAAIGMLFKKGIKEGYKNTIMDGIGLSVLVIGISNALEFENLVVVIVSIVIGSIIGELIDINKRLNNLGDRLQSKFKNEEGNFSKGFVTASLVYCVGAMAIVGAIQSGLTGNHQTLYAKAVLDGITAIIFASTLGIGVMFSSLAVFLYQGTITIFASSLSSILTEIAINEISSVGGILIIAIGINLLGLKEIKIANMLPAIIIPPVYYFLLSL
ncbi:DUF554 domain-containing protein [Soehngenia longivitae]|jgi:hypothetical protein|uniref:DUF554 domain-containing protein n=1 Tax=Soehngenia longivitae TaxID=2562294 RepID=A0A4Z0DA56_9FIRM|nr:DUF554 domain-containing protein [Soehngenia longivitae]TFZ41743.1 DUF554 domain-containing protein [Soehngenia longivitae]